MPIDASIYSSIPAAPVADPLEMQGRILTLRHMAQQGQLGQEQLKAAQMENQGRELDLQDQQVMREAYARAVQGAGTPGSGAAPSGGDVLERLRNDVAGKVSPKAMMGLDAAIVGNQEKRSIASKNNAEALHYQAQNAKLHNDAVGQATGALLQLPPDQQAANYPQVRAALVQGGHISPSDAPEAFPGQDWLQIHHDAAMSADQQITAHIAQLKEGREQALFPAELASKQADAQTKARQNAATQLAAAQSPDQYKQMLDSMPHGVAVQFPQQWDPKTTPAQVLKLGMSPDQAAVTGETQRHNAVEEKQSAQRIGLEGARVGMEQKRFNMTLGAGLDANGQPKIDPATGKPVQNPLAAAIANYQIPPISARAMASPQGAALMAQVMAINPQFKGEQFQTISSMRKSFASGKQGQNIGALNTATVHLDQFADAADAMNNNNFRPGNAVYNAIRSTFGEAAPTNFDSLKVAVSGELANALKGNATDVEIHNIEKAVQSANSPAQLKGFIQTQMHVLGAKLNTYDEQYHQQIPGDTWSPVLPSAAAVYQKNGISPIRRGNASPDVGGTALPKGGGKTIDKATAHMFYQAAGGDPAKARKMATDAGWQVQ